MTRISVKEAAEYFQISPVTLRYLMKAGGLNIGTVVKRKGRCTYLIYKEMCERVEGWQR